MKWKPIAGFENYSVNENGEIKNTKSGELKKPSVSGGGYLMVCLYKDSRYRRDYVHRIVAEAFLENPNGYSEINHKDENKSNNKVSNLEWCTRTYNQAKAFGRPVVAYKDGVEVARYSSIAEAARDVGLCDSSIFGAINNIRNHKVAAGLEWSYATPPRENRVVPFNKEYSKNF